MPFAKDESHWLYKLSPDEWIRAAMSELRRAEEAYAHNNPRAGLAGAKRAAGMALNGALIVEPNDAWGRSYVDHVAAVARDAQVPKRVREASTILHEAQAPAPGGVVALRTKAAEERVLEAVRDLVAHAYAIVKKHEALGGR